MTIAILILAYILLFDNLYWVWYGEESNIVVSSALVILLSWQVNTAWGITMLCILSVITLIAILTPKR